MQFIYVLVVAVAILTVLAGIALVFGSSKAERNRSFWFLLAAVGEVIWAVSIAMFLSLGTGSSDVELAPWLIKGIYIGALVMDAALLAYISWKSKLGKILSVIFTLICVTLVVLLCYDPSILYTDIVLQDSGNSVLIDTGKWFYAVYVIYFVSLNMLLCLFLLNTIRHTTNKKTRQGYIYFLIGLTLTGILSGIFDLILPLFRYDLIWVGPLTIGLTILSFYFSILKFKIISLDSLWLKILSSIVVISSAFIIYLLIFHLVFSALFRTPRVSFDVVLLNFIMIAVVLVLVPAFSEIMSLVKSLMMTKQIDLPYIVKKLSTLDRKKLSKKDVSGFLAEHMHFSYIAFLTNDRLYVADDCKIPSEVVAEINRLPISTNGAWLDTSKISDETMKESEISEIAIMTGGNGEAVGLMIFGKPTSKVKLEQKDLIEMSMVVSLMGIIIEDGRRSKS